MTNLWEDNRGKTANLVISFFAAIVMISLLTIVFAEPLNVVHDTALNQSSTSYSATGIGYWWQLVEWFPLFGVIISMLGVLAGIIFVTRGGL